MKRLTRFELYNPPFVNKNTVSISNSLYMKAQMKMISMEYGITMDYNKPKELQLNKNNNIDEEKKLLIINNNNENETIYKKNENEINKTNEQSNNNKFFKINFRKNSNKLNLESYDIKKDKDKNNNNYISTK